MPSKGKGGTTVNTVWEIAEPIAQSLGLELWDVRFEKEGAGWYLRVFIDKEDGVSIDDCVDMSHALDKHKRAGRPTLLNHQILHWKYFTTKIIKYQ